MNKLRKIEIVDLKIPFITEFRHHTASRASTQTVIVIASDGTWKGYGEGCPREYVTGESIASAFDFFDKIKGQILTEISDLNTLKIFWGENSILINKNPSAWCAIELALLDLFSKQQKCSLEKLLEVPELHGEFNYTAIIGDDALDEFKQSADRYFKMSFTDFKIKVNGDTKADHEKLNYLKSVNKNCAIRVDANNLWVDPTDVIEYVNTLPCKISGFEEPLKSKNIAALRLLADKIQIPIILDESCCTLEQLAVVAHSKTPFIINLRVSKMGGLLNSLMIAKACKINGLKLIIGAQVGETSILTRAGLCVANTIAPGYAALEGAFGTLLLQYDIVKDSLTFGKGGKLTPEKQLNKNLNGFQLNILEEYFG